MHTNITHTHTHVHTHTHTHAQTNTHTLTNKNTHTNTHTHTHFDRQQQQPMGKDRPVGGLSAEGSTSLAGDLIPRSVSTVSPPSHSPLTGSDTCVASASHAPHSA